MVRMHLFDGAMTRCGADVSLQVESRFWDRLVLQACDAEPAVKHVALALASFHNSIITQKDRDVSQQHRVYAERQYQRALTEAKQLIDCPSTKHLDRILMVCVLFILFEGLRGNYAASRAHMDSGRAIAARYRPVGLKTSNKNCSSEISEVFARLDLVALTFSDDTSPYKYTLDDLLSTAPQLQPSRFDRTHSAYVSLIDLIRWLLVLESHQRFLLEAPGRNPGDLQEQVRRCRERLCEWRYHWDELQLQCAETGSLLGKSVEIWYSMAATIVDAGFLGPESRYDVLLHHFRRIVHFGEDVSVGISENRDLAFFSLDLGFVTPVFFCAIRCRDPHLRRSAIRVLGSQNRQEGIWESTVAAAIAKRWMQLEEEGLGEIERAEQIPESKRIAVLDTQVNVEQSTAHLRFTTSTSLLAMDEEYRHEDLHWNRS